MTEINKNYVCYHLHTDLSLLDSCTKAKDYVELAVKLGQKAIAFTEHGNLFNWVSKKQICDQMGVKYIHGVECYLTQDKRDNNGSKIRDNFHTILLAKNYEGVKEINLAMSKASDSEHFYYNSRITFDEFFALSNNVIKISACLASPLNRVRKTAFEEIPCETFEKLCYAYDYYEVQPHVYSQEQKEYNRWLADLAKKYNKPLIAGTDTHNLNEYKSACRKILMKYKGQSYGDEDTFDLNYKSYEELVECFKNQKALTEEEYLEAIENTNVMADSVEEFTLDTSFKYPHISDHIEEDFLGKLFAMFNEKLKLGYIPQDKKQEYLSRIKEEYEVFKKLDMLSFMLFMSNLIGWCKSNNIPVGLGRGSVSGSLIAYILGITDVDSIEWHTIFSRFANENRKVLADIDVDVRDEDKPRIYKHIIDSFGLEHTAFVLSIGTVADRGTIDIIGKVLDYSLDEVARIKDEYDADESENKQVVREKYERLFYYFDGLVNTSISRSIHPAGILICPWTIMDNYGIVWANDKGENKHIINLNMDESHELGILKYDLLSLVNISIIQQTCDLAHIPFPNSKTLNWNDEEVWKHMLDSPVGLFQMNGDFAFSSLKKFEPHSISDIDLVTAAIRPSGASFRDKLFAKEWYKNPSPMIDELLKNNYGYLLYQEDCIAFLQQICGFSGGDADTVRRYICAKKEDKIAEWLPRILEGYCRKSNKPREVAEEEAKTFLKIIEDSASYQFNYNHAQAYSMLTYICAYLRYYYPYEFVTAYLNCAANNDDIKDGTQLANEFGIKIYDIEFGKSKDKYAIGIENNERIIYKGLSSLKGFGEEDGSKLFQLYEEHLNASFLELLPLIIQTIGKAKMLILAQLNYFRKYGKTQKIVNMIQIFVEFGTAKSFTLAKLTTLNDKYNISSDLIKGYCSKVTAKTYSGFDNDRFIRDMWAILPNEHLNLGERLNAELEYYGSISYVNSQFKNFYVVLDVRKTKSGVMSITVQDLSDKSLKVYTCGETYKLLEEPLSKGTIFQLLMDKLKPKYRFNSNYVEGGDEPKYFVVPNEYKNVLINWKTYYTPLVKEKKK